MELEDYVNKRRLISQVIFLDEVCVLDDTWSCAYLLKHYVCKSIVGVAVLNYKF